MYRVHWLLAGDVNFPMHHLHKNKIYKVASVVIVASTVTTVDLDDNIMGGLSCMIYLPTLTVAA